MNHGEARKTFASPPMRSRPAPFWFWNDHLDPERLKGQFDRLLESGMGGAVLHARHGLEPAEYLDQRWFDAVGAVVQHAHARGADTWLYDELGWPSGTAGGRIPREHPEFQMLHLRLCDVTSTHEAELPRATDDIVAAFHVTRGDATHGSQRRHDGSVTLLPDRIDCEPIPLDSLSSPAWLGKRLLVFRIERHEGAINYLDRRATEAFLRSTHEEYYARFREYFGSTIRHSFMDEAGMGASVARIPWDGAFEAEFVKRRGYSPIPHLPALFFDVPGCEAMRYDYWSLAAELFRENFAMPMHEWCIAHGIAYTGHYVFETTLKEAIRQLGSTMPLYEYQGLPGIDVLGNDFYSRRFEQEAYGYYAVMIKQAASVSHQLGKGGLMSESYGVGGHAMGPEAMQTATNFQMALGVTIINQHAVFYSQRGDRKLDCPPAIGWQQPYWPFIRKHMDTIARTGWLLNQGQHACDVLVLHPAASMQASYRHFRVPHEYKAENYLLDADLPFELIDKHFTLLSVALLDAQIDFDYGDEEIMARHGAAEAGRLRIGQESYKFVVLPPSTNIRGTTLELLRAFFAQGGRILTMGSLPYLVDGRPSTAAREFFQSHALCTHYGVDFFDYRPTIDGLTMFGARRVTLNSPSGENVPALKMQRRHWDACEILYLANVSQEPAMARLTYRTDITGCVEEWDPASGKTQTLANCQAGQDIELDLTWAARQARAFMVVPGEAEVPPVVSATERQRIQPTWTGKRNGPNMLVLDECRLVDEGAPKRRLPVWQVQKLIRPKGLPVTIITKYEVHVSKTLPCVGPCELAIELGGNPTVALNGRAIALDSTAWIIDPAIRRIPGPALSPGVNVFEVQGTYEKETDLQPPWLLGNFLLDGKRNPDFKLQKNRDAVEIGAWPELGLHFYAGTVTYRAEVDLANLPRNAQVKLEMPGLEGSAEVRVNGRIVDHVLWPPYECDISSFVNAGTNAVEIEVANTLRNLLGPHFDPDEAIHTGPSDETYRGEPGQPKRFWPYGLLQAPEIVVYETAATTTGR